ncbi:MAG: nucleotidyltransferase domain-containing protein [Candidatus Nanoarchaeia archaeon]|nr:nucleotidyltransferase domain-containing protein [Candidatus Nanoarchaeia archaeon]MDD5499638.1 nucleotidyltransferase domain-containing protein [Candidatus Nanoarchaeia archaeon]
MAKKRVSKKTAEKKQDPIVSELLSIFNESLISVSKVEFVKEEEEEGEKKDLPLPKTEEQIIAVVNDLADEKAAKLMENYKSAKAKLLPLSGLWQSCYDQKYELMGALTNPQSSKILYDKGFIKGLTAAQVLKTMSLGKLKRYILSIILVGSVSRGTMHEHSDVDLSFVIDDTDVKKMSRHEVLARLRGMITQMAAQTGFEFNIQVYLLTDFWQSLRDTQPVIFSMVRDGVPLYDTGMFMPWRTLLKTGKMKPSPEAVEQFFKTGRLLIDDVGNTIKELVIERLFLSMLNPAQAATMLIGIPPTHHGDTPKLFKKHFVDDLKLIEPKYVDYLTDVLELRKGVEYGKIKEISPEKFLEQINRAKEFQDRMDKLFKDVRQDLIKKSLEESEDKSVKAIIETLKAMNVKASEKDAEGLLRSKMLDSGLITQKDYNFFAKKLKNSFVDFKKDLLTTEEASLIEKEAVDFISRLNNIKEMLELKSSERSKVHFRADGVNGELWIFEKEVFIVSNLKKMTIYKAGLKEDGSFDKPAISNANELSEARKSSKMDEMTSVSSKMLENLKQSLNAKEVEIVIV